MAAGYLLTGGTGVVGSTVLAELLAVRTGPIHLVLRGDSQAGVEARAKKLWRFLGLDAGDLRLASVVLHRGDVTERNFGLSSDALHRVRREVSRIVHAAGDVHMGRTLREARAAALESAQHVVHLADSIGPRLEKLEVVSTVGVGGRATSPLREVFPCPPPTLGFHNTYEQAKAEAEAYLHASARALPLTIHRPSMVVGDSQTGRSIRRQVFAALCHLLSGAPTRGVLPQLDGKAVDLIPQDFVARAIVWSSQTQLTRGAVLHLCSGATEAASLRRLLAHVQAAQRTLGHTRHRLRFVPINMYRHATRALAVCVPHAAGPQVRLLTILLDYLRSVQRFDNERTLRMLAPHGMALPESRTYLGRVVRESLLHHDQRGGLV